MTTIPVYLVVDASSSLASDIQTVNEGVRSLFETILIDPLLTRSVRVSVIQFGSDAREVMTLSDIQEIASYPVIEASGATNYGAAFRLVRRVIPRDLAAMRAAGERVYRPIMVFITDGSPTDLDWREALHELQSPEFRERPTIVAFGIGSVDPSVLREIGSAPGGAFVLSSHLSTSEAIGSIFHGLAAMFTSTVQSTVAPWEPVAAVTLSENWVDLSSIPDEP